MRNEKKNTIILIKKNKRVIVYFAISIIILTSVLILGYDIGLIKALGIGICGYLLAFVIASTSLRNILLYVKYRCFGNDKLSIEIDEICNEIYHRSSDRNNRININIRNEGKDEVLFLAKDTISVAKSVLKLPIECIKALIARGFAENVNSDKHFLKTKFIGANYIIAITLLLDKVVLNVYPAFVNIIKNMQSSNIEQKLVELNIVLYGLAWWYIVKYGVDLWDKLFDKIMNSELKDTVLDSYVVKLGYKNELRYYINCILYTLNSELIKNKAEIKYNSYRLTNIEKSNGMVNENTIVKNNTLNVGNEYERNLQDTVIKGAVNNNDKDVNMLYKNENIVEKISMTIKPLINKLNEKYVNSKYKKQIMIGVISGGVFLVVFSCLVTRNKLNSMAHDNEDDISTIAKENNINYEYEKNDYSSDGTLENYEYKEDDYNSDESIGDYEYKEDDYNSDESIGDYKYEEDDYNSDESIGDYEYEEDDYNSDESIGDYEYEEDDYNSDYSLEEDVSQEEYDKNGIMYSDYYTSNGFIDSGNENYTYDKSVDASEYVLYNSHVDYVNYEDVSNMTPKQLRLARNEIFARYGCIFKSDDLNKYFKKTSWYKPSIAVADFDLTMFNDYELKNIKLIQLYEKN